MMVALRVRWDRVFSSAALLMMLGAALLFTGHAGAAKTTLRVMDWKLNETKATQAWFQSAKERFEAAHPGVEVALETAPWGDEYRQKVITGVAAGTAPDVVSLSIIWARDLYDAGVLLTLNPFIQKTPALAPSQFVPATQLYNQAGGRFFGITNAMDAAALMYDVDAFDESGLDSRPDGLATWNDFITAARKLTRIDSSGSTTRWGYSGGTGLEPFNSWLVANGGSFYTDDLNHPGFNNQAGRETAQFIADLVTVYRVLGGDVNNRTAAMGHGGNWRPYFLAQSQPDMRFNLTSYPQGPSGKGRGTTVWGNMWSITSSSKNVDLAWDWITYYCGLEGNIAMFEALNYTYVNSPRLDFYRSSVWSGKARQSLWMPQVPRIASVGGVYPYRRNSDLAASVWNPLLSRAVNGQAPVASTFEQAHKLYEAILTAQK